MLSDGDESEDPKEAVAGSNAARERMRSSDKAAHFGPALCAVAANDGVRCTARGTVGSTRDPCQRLRGTARGRGRDPQGHQRTTGNSARARRVDFPRGTSVEVDGVSADLSVFTEGFAHVGPMKGGQKRKVALDVLKLITLQRSHPSARLVLAFCDEGAMGSLTGWIGEAIAAWKLDRRLAPIDAELCGRLLQVQARQYR